MLSVPDSAILSYLSYCGVFEDIKEGAVSQVFELNSILQQHENVFKHWTVLKIVEYREIGYRGVIFKNNDDAVVMAHRGSLVDESDESSFNITCEFSLLSKGDPSLSDFNQNLKKFIDIVSSNVNDTASEFEVKYHVGYGLGGFVAELLASLNENGKCCTFDSFGTNDEFITKQISKKYYSGSMNRLHFSMQPNIFNTAMKVNGFRYVVGNIFVAYCSRYFNEGRLGLNELREFYVLGKYHPMATYLENIFSDFPSYHEVVEWPQADNTFGMGEPMPPFFAFFRKMCQQNVQELLYDVEYFVHKRHGHQRLYETFLGEDGLGIPLDANHNPILDF